MLILTFLLSLLAFVIIGMLSSLVKRDTSVDYLLAEHSVPPWLVALSAIATNNSGYMFIGMIGYTYKVGLASVWVLVGWILGDLIASIFIHKKLRITTETSNALSFPSILSQWHGTNFKIFRVLSALFIIVFLGTYSAAM
jgi:sodium/proline symporter